MENTVFNEEVLIDHTLIKEGCVISSPHFRNLLFRDVLNLDPICGFYVNPMSEIKTWVDVTTVKTILLESRGSIFSGRGNGSKSMKNIKMLLPEDHEFVVISKRRCVYFPIEYLDGTECGNYPWEIIAKMVSPDGSYDPFGLEIYFYMETNIQKHAVNEVYMQGYIIHNWEKLL